MSSLADFSAEVRRQVDVALEQQLATQDHPAPGLISAMHYSLFNGGKRVRPLLVFAAAEASGETNPAVLACACAVELIHAYSLVHDDLPAMDNDDLRRGKPTVHIAFDEATAILAGDALQTAAFELLANTPFSTSSQAIACISELAQASGARGMAGGQFIDLKAVGEILELGELKTMHGLKTGALIGASVRLGALAANLDQSDRFFKLLSDYGAFIGLAFQIKDDLLDATGDTAVIGKRSGADASAAKPNFVSLMGVAGAQTQLEKTCGRALEIANTFGQRGTRLKELVHLVSDRTL
jgi:geranylgeranyl diphosphate synthase, type II